MTREYIHDKMRQVPHNSLVKNILGQWLEGWEVVNSTYGVMEGRRQTRSLKFKSGEAAVFSLAPPNQKPF